MMTIGIQGIGTAVPEHVVDQRMVRATVERVFGGRVADLDRLLSVFEHEGVRPQRPMTHDLLRSVIETLGASVKEVVISEIKEGTFYAKIIFDYSDLEVDARPSDAIALAVRCGAPLFISEEIMDEVSLRAEDIEEVDADQAGEESDTTPAASATPQREAPTQLLTDRQRLEQELDQAIKVEDYEGAARIRDELQRLDS